MIRSNIYNPIDPSKFGTPPFLDPATAPSAILVDFTALNFCTPKLYGVSTSYFKPSQPNAGGSFIGTALFSDNPLQSFTVTNNLSMTMNQIAHDPRNKDQGPGVTGFVDPTNPYITYTGSDTFTMRTIGRTMFSNEGVDTQLSELGNSLQIITSPGSLQQMYARDKTVISTTIGEVRNDVPGGDLTKCVYDKIILNDYSDEVSTTR